jgi:hypothetical protein
VPFTARLSLNIEKVAYYLWMPVLGWSHWPPLSALLAPCSLVNTALHSPLERNTGHLDLIDVLIAGLFTILQEVPISNYY